jgi:release factor glutamine methyltransferase
VCVAKNWDLYGLLPSTLSAEEILAAYDVAPSTAERRSYLWNGWDFDLPPGVFKPGTTSRLLHDRLLNGTLPLADLRYAAMGVGLGVEAVVAGVRGAATVYALDIHEESVHTTARHYSRIVGDGGPPFVGVISDLWEELSDEVQLDVVTFNPPFIDVRLSDDPYIVRNRCMGYGLAARFFDQLVSRRLLAAGGVVYLTLSNTEPLRDIVAMALRAGFDVEALHVEDWPATSVQTYLFALRERPRTSASETTLLRARSDTCV